MNLNYFRIRNEDIAAILRVELLNNESSRRDRPSESAAAKIGR